MDKRNESDFNNYQKVHGNFDLKVNINKKRENSINQLLSLIPGNEFINKKRKKNKSNIKNTENKQEEKDQFRKILEKRKHLLQKSFSFKESNPKIINVNKETNKEELLFKNEDKNDSIQFTLINTNKVKYVPDYEPWDKELLEIIFSNQNDKNLLNNYSSISEEELKKYISSKLSENDLKLLDLISYTQHPTPQINYAKDKEDSTNLQFILTKKEKRSLKKIYHEQKRKDEQEKIKLGLMKPKEKKLKYSNMIQLFSNASFSNPSQIYQKVENSYKEREKRMLEENAKNTLTKEQKKIKFKEKIDKDQEKGLYGYFFKINKIYDIENNNRFNSWMKIFCKKYKISGFLINFFKQNENFAYLEGGQKALNKIQRRIGNKLKIEQNNLRKKEEDKKIKEKSENSVIAIKIQNVNNKEILETKKINNDNISNEYSCVLKWKGIIKKKSFYHFQVLIKKNHQELLDFFEDNNLIHLNNNIN